MRDWKDHGKVTGPEIKNPLLMIEEEGEVVSVYWRTDLTQEQRYELSGIIQADLKRRAQ